MRYIRLDSLFNVSYGTNLELNSLEECANGINFVSRTAKNNGVSARVKRLTEIDPLPSGLLTVATGGSVLETFLQSEPFYSGRDLYYLTPKVHLTENQKLFYCACIKKNKFRYNYGRQANKTLKALMLPALDAFPSWVNEKDDDLKSYSLPVENKMDAKLPPVSKWQVFIYEDIFEIQRGQSFYLKNLKVGDYPYVSASSENNGISARVSIFNQMGGAISLAYDGSVGEAFYQPERFLASEKIVSIRLRKRFNYSLNPYLALFLITLIRKEKFRYNYGLKWSVESRMKKSVIKLPVDSKGAPNWSLMENYIKSLPYSSAI